MARVLVIDNYDSFVYNLVQYLGQLGAETVVWRNDDRSPADVAAGVIDDAGADGVLLSPGPGTPAEAGSMAAVIEWAAQRRLPTLGVCLGHQAIAEVYGGVVQRADELLHGRTSLISHDDAGVFAGLPDPLTVTRYHSLAVQDGTVPDELEVTARTVTAGGAGADGPGVIMGLRHRTLPLQGVQFHPESVLTQGGHALLANWLVELGDTAAPDRVAPLADEVERLRLRAG